MVMIQQTMDFCAGVRKDIFSVLPKKGGAGKTKDEKPSAALLGNKRMGNISVSAFCTKLSASGITIGRNRMFKWLRKNGYISRQKGTWNMPLQKYVSEGILAVKRNVRTGRRRTGGEIFPSYHPQGQGVPGRKAYSGKRRNKKEKDGIAKEPHYAALLFA